MVMDEKAPLPDVLTARHRAKQSGVLPGCAAPFAAWRPVVLLWLFWLLLLCGFQAYTVARFAPLRPDYALPWTPGETGITAQYGKPYLLEPFLNEHVAWDSEYYISISLGGYDDPRMSAIPPDFNWRNSQIQLKSQQPDWITLNHAFLPFYPLLMRVLALPLGVLGLDAIATATLAGVLVALLGTLAALLALYELAGGELNAARGRRAAFYLLIWPASLFLAQVYTEGLFLGLSFGALALARRAKWLAAALLAVGATWTRSAGLLLVLPLAWYWWQQGNPAQLRRRLTPGPALNGLLVCAPIAAYLLWNALLGTPFHAVEDRYFGRGLLLLDQSLQVWGAALTQLFTGNPQAQAYYLVEFAAIAFGLLACWQLRLREPALALYSLALLGFALTSGVAQGMHRYVLAAPVIFLLPAHWGRNELFDRAWTVGNVLLLAVFAAMFSADMWAG